MKFNKNLLTKEQQKFLDIISSSSIAGKFYLSGGTALTTFYIPYRYSDDLDFFSEGEVDSEEILTYIRSIKEQLGYRSVDFRTSFNRNLIFLQFDKDYTLKLEFTYYPFPRIEESQKIESLEIDSVFDIAVNKLFTIYQNPRTRDFTDLYMIMQEEDFNLDSLIKKAKIKFDWHVDPLQLGKQFMKVSDKKDYPKLITSLDDEEYEVFFLDLAKRLAKQELQ